MTGDPDHKMGNEKAMRVVSFVAAASNSGKTTLIEKLVALFTARGFRVAVIKHTSAGFDLDRAGKDSWRFQQAGADTVILAAPGKVALIQKNAGEPNRTDLERMAGTADIVFCEGFKTNAENKIEVFRHGVSGHRPLCLDDPSFLALVSDRRFSVSLPQMDINDVEGIAEFIMSKSDEADTR